eukprot:GFUD01079153.1.p1 GENE.GFUD01079153.1~~GFUD01079153.1.p1  ORF type:complete len:247 (+),score=63.93 GFUD01079153.1:84-743(+)
MQPGHFIAVVAVWSVGAQGFCSSGEECISIRSCLTIVKQLTIAKETSDLAEKRLIISQVKEKVCGERKERTVCCARESSSLEEDESAGEGGEAVSIGLFKNIFHDISGQAYALDSKTVLIKGFTYDGEGPDTFFLAGTSGSRPSSRKGDVVLPWPNDGNEYSYNDRNIPLIKQSFDGKEDIVLTLPPGKTVDQLKWISVWCRDFDVNFGHVNFPENFSL